MSKLPAIRESEVLQQVKQYLKVLGFHMQRHAVGCFVTQPSVAEFMKLASQNNIEDGKGKLKYVKTGKAGDPDLKGSFLGVTVWVEVKAPGKRPSLAQTLRMIELNANGDIAFWVDGIDHLLKICDHIRSGGRIWMNANGDFDLITKEDYASINTR
jgi:hypothetical protein